ncbi:hypothetical protein [Sphingosinicella sp.]|uniref:hypothetical protein n=1 Tax=Sphingosinicella sp. TaxID=1917971 RepID=UPI004037AA90
MKLVIREYLASLRERDELDAVLPDLLTELGFTVFSRPTRGTRQHGVDVGAVGLGEDGVRRVHLFSVKSGDLTRTEWNTASPQSLRPSLEAILDVYVASRIPPQYADLPIAICLCFGGDIDEQVRDDVHGFMRRNRTEKIHFEEWNGDRLAQVILDGILREELLPETLRGHLRKAVAMVEEPDIAINHFQRLLRALSEAPGAKPANRLSQARLINICLWIMFIWAREANNVEAPYRASEHALLAAWHLLRSDLAKGGKTAERAGLVLNELIELHFAVGDELFDAKILPLADVRHGLSSAVGSHASIDVNLKLFDMIGRLALRGLWLVWQAGSGDRPGLLPDVTEDDTLAALNAPLIGRIQRMCSQINQLIANNHALLSPASDWQAIDIGLALTLLSTRAHFHDIIDQWLEELARHCIFAFQTHGRYPTTSQSYWDLVEHPAQRDDAYRREATNASTLYPMLALWAAARGNQPIIDEFARFKAELLEHCTFQAWLPDEDSETELYLGRDSHGAALAGIPVTAGTRDTLEFVMAEVTINDHFDALSAIRLAHWPILLTACRVHRLPIPPHLWRDIFAAIGPALQSAGPIADTSPDLESDDDDGAVGAVTRPLSRDVSRAPLARTRWPALRGSTRYSGGGCAAGVPRIRSGVGASKAPVQVFGPAVMVSHRVEFGEDRVQLRLLGRLRDRFQLLVVGIVRQGVEDPVPGRGHAVLRRPEVRHALTHPGDPRRHARLSPRPLAGRPAGRPQEGADDILMAHWVLLFFKRGPSTMLFAWSPSPGMRGRIEAGRGSTFGVFNGG